MYHETGIINGVLCWRDTPDGAWVPYGSFDLGPKVTVTEGIHDEQIAHVAPEDFEETIERIRLQLAWM